MQVANPVADHYGLLGLSHSAINSTGCSMARKLALLILVLVFLDVPFVSAHVARHRLPEP